MSEKSLRARLRAAEIAARSVRCPRCSGERLTVKGVRLDGSTVRIGGGDTRPCSVCGRAPRRILIREVAGVPITTGAPGTIQ